FKALFKAIEKELFQDLPNAKKKISECDTTDLAQLVHSFSQAHVGTISLYETIEKILLEPLDKSETTRLSQCSEKELVDIATAFSKACMVSTLIMKTLSSKILRRGLDSMKGASLISLLWGIVIRGNY